MGWRARYVIAVDAIKKDVDPDHPLFVTTTARNIFQRVWRDQVKNNGGGKKPAKRPRTECTENQGASRGVIPQFLFGDTPTTRPISWVEILCQSDDTDKQKRQAKFKPDGKPKMRWIHVDPRYELVNEPGLVEAALHAERKERASLNEKVKIPISYALAAEHIDISCETRMRLTDVTPRYASSMIESLKTRGILRGKQNQVKDKERVDKWLTETLKFMNSGGKSRDETLFSKGKSLSDAIVLDDASVDGDTKAKSDKDIEEVDDHEKEELKASSQDEPLPTSKTAFNTHPVYVIPSVLNQNEVLVPDAKERICGVFKGELVFRRVDVQCAFPAKRWLYKGRKVKESEFNNPIKRVKAKAKSSKGFKALKSYGIGTDNDGSEEARAKIIAAASRPLDDNKEDLYASWQTDSWAPVPVGANEPIPVNEFNNIELELLNPGLAHVEEHRIAVVAKKLGMYVQTQCKVRMHSVSGLTLLLFRFNLELRSPYAPCLLGFEGHRGNRTPTIRGIVVHEHNADLLREAHVEMASQLIEEEHESKQQSVYQKWKRLLVGVLTKDRLDKAYGHDDG